MGSDGWSDSGSPTLKIIAATLAMALFVSAGLALYWRDEYHQYRAEASSIKTAFEDANDSLAFQSMTISSLEDHAQSQPAPELLLNELPITLTNTSTLVLSYNATATGYITMNGTASSKSWVVACWGASDMFECENDVTSGTNYALMAYWDGMKVPVFPGPMVIMMSSVGSAEIALTAVAFV